MKNLENDLNETSSENISSPVRSGIIYEVVEKIFKIRKTISDSQPNWYKAFYGMYRF